MLFSIDDRLSTSPFVERVWRCRSQRSGSFLSLPEGNLELVITRLPGLRMVTLRGPVNTAEEKAKISAAAQHVNGVKQVQNQLKIASQ